MSAVLSIAGAAKQAATRSPLRRGRAASVPARRSSITRLLLGSHHPDAAHLALLNEVNKSDVGLVECIVPHWGASLSGFFTQQLIHCQSFLQNWSPFFRQILCRNHSKANAFDQTAIFGDRPKRLNSHSFPHQLRISSGKRLISYPICECQSAICPQNTKSFGNRSLHIRNVAKCFLADDSVDARVSKRHVHHVALDNPRSTVKANASGQLRCARDARWRQFDTGDVGSVFVSQITHRAAKSRTEIRDPR